MWSAIKSFFKDSETIFYARLQMFLGGLAAIITYFDPQMLAPVLPVEWLPWVIIANGIATEYLRRRRADDLEQGP